MILFLQGCGIGAAAAAAWWYLCPPRVTPDGELYLRAGSGLPVPKPFSGRVLVPLVCGVRPVRWRVVSTASLVVAAGLLAVFLSAGGASDAASLVGVGLLVGLPGIFRVGMEAPILTDQAALVAGLGAAVAVVSGHHWLGAALALLGGTIRESVPVWAAIYAWSWVPLVGLIAVLAVGLFVRSAPPSVVTNVRRQMNLVHPFLSARLPRTVDAGNVFVAWVAPWGAVAVLVVLGAASWGLQLAVALGFGYAHLLFAVDRARLYQQASPVVVAVAVVVISPPWAAAALVAHYVNPWRGDGY